MWETPNLGCSEGGNQCRGLNCDTARLWGGRGPATPLAEQLCSALLAPGWWPRDLSGVASSGFQLQQRGRRFQPLVKRESALSVIVVLATKILSVQREVEEMPTPPPKKRRVGRTGRQRHWSGARTQLFLVHILNLKFQFGIPQMSGIIWFLTFSVWLETYIILLTIVTPLNLILKNNLKSSRSQQGFTPFWISHAVLYLLHNVSEDSEMLASGFDYWDLGNPGLWKLSKRTVTRCVNIGSVYVDIALITLHCEYWVAPSPRHWASLPSFFVCVSMAPTQCLARQRMSVC